MEKHSSEVLSPLASEGQVAEKARKHFGSSKTKTIDHLPPSGASVYADELDCRPRESIQRELSHDESMPIKELIESVDQMIERAGGPVNEAEEEVEDDDREEVLPETEEYKKDDTDEEDDDKQEINES